MRASILLLAAASLASTFAKHAPFMDPGIGLSLSSGYGTISAHFRNGTSINIAKIEGSASYKAFMRSVNEEPDQELVAQPQLQSTWSLTSCPLPDRLCRYWPGHGKSKNALYPMLSALRTAAEATLELPVNETILSFSGTQDYQAFDLELKAALDRAGLKVIHHQPKLNGYVASTLLAPQGRCPRSICWDEWATVDCSRFILTIEYTRAALSASLWEEDCYVYEVLRHNHSFELGTESLDTCYAGGSDNCDVNLHAALANITRSPLGPVFGFPHWKDGPVVIEAVIMLGEAGADARLNAALKDILKNQTGGNDFGTQLHRTKTDLAFAASLGAATYASRIEWDQ